MYKLLREYLFSEERSHCLYSILNDLWDLKIPTDPETLSVASEREVRKIPWWAKMSLGTYMALTWLTWTQFDLVGLCLVKEETALGQGMSWFLTAMEL